MVFRSIFYFGFRFLVKRAGLVSNIYMPCTTDHGSSIK